MKKILIILGTYFPRPLANGICVHQIALELKKMGYEVHAICIGNSNFNKQELYDGIYVYPVKKRLFLTVRDYAEKNIDSFKGKVLYRIAMLMNKIKKILYLPFYPMTSLNFVWRYYKLARDLHNKHKFNLVLSVYNPLEALIAGMMLKNRYKESIKYVIYSLDSLTNDGGVRYVSKNWTGKKGWQWEKRFYQYADKILNLQCHEMHHNKERYSVFKRKMEIVDIPLFRKLDNNVTSLRKTTFDKTHIHWVYAGGLSLESRSPLYLCKIFVHINVNHKNKLHFYSRGDCEDLIMNFQEKSEGYVVRHGYVSAEDSVNVVCNADILVSIGNKNSDMIPSKIFEYMSTGKKVIHFSESENDSCIPYYSQYPLALLINEKESFQENVNKINSFINSPCKEISWISLKKSFTKNTPEYTVMLIEDILT